MKILLSYPTNGTNKTYEISNKDSQRFYGLKINDQFNGKIIASELEDCIIEITGGNDTIGVCMVPNQNHSKSVRLLLKNGDIGYRARKSYIRKRKTVRGSIVSSDTAVINAILVKPRYEGENEALVPGLTDVIKDKSYLPKKASKLKRMFGIDESEQDKEKIKEKIYKLIRENDANAKLPKLKITGTISEAERKLRNEKLVMRKKRTENFQKLKANFNKDLLKNYSSQ